MWVYSITILGLLFIIFGFLVWLRLTLKDTPQFLVIMGLLLGLCALGVWINPDLKKAYEDIYQKQELSKAKQILSSPQQFNQLLKNLQERVKTAPNDSKAWFLLGRLYAQKEEWPAAHDALFQAHRLEPQNIKTGLFYVETVWHIEQQLTTYARKILQEILEQEPNQPDALVMLAADAKAHHCSDRALKYLNALISIVPQDSPMYHDINREIKNLEKDSDHKCSILK